MRIKFIHSKIFPAEFNYHQQNLIIIFKKNIFKIFEKFLPSFRELAVASSEKSSNIFEVIQACLQVTLRGISRIDDYVESSSKEAFLAVELAVVWIKDSAG